MKFYEILKGKQWKSLLMAVLIGITIASPLQAQAYSTDQVTKLDNTNKVAATLTFSDKDKVDITLDSRPTFLTTPAYVTGGRTMLPVRAVAQLLKAEVNFEPNNTKGLIQINKDSQEILLKLARNGIVTNEQLGQIDPSNKNIGASTFNGTTYLPLRAVANALGVEVNYVNGKVDIITGNPITPPITDLVTGQQIVKNTNPEITAPMMDLTSPRLEGERWVVPEGLIYKNPAGLKPGDKLTMDQIKTLMPEIYNNFVKGSGVDNLKNYTVIYLPEGARFDSSKKEGNWTYNTLSPGIAGRYNFRDGDHNLKGTRTPSSAWSGTVVLNKPWTISSTYTEEQLGFDAGGVSDLRRAGGLSNINYIIYGTSADSRNNFKFVTFYTIP